jgi:methionyl-tRNA formyltransferase
VDADPWVRNSRTDIFWLDDGVNSGDILVQEPVDVARNDEASDLFAKHADLSVTLLNDAVELFSEGQFPRTSQDDSEATYTHPRRPDMGIINWTQSANSLYDFIRDQSHPYPGAFTYNAMDRTRVWHATVEHPTRIIREPGIVLKKHSENRLSVQTGEGILQIEIEREDDTHPLGEGNILSNHSGSAQ